LHGRLFDHGASRIRRIAIPQQLKRVAEGHAFNLHHKADDVPTFAAGSEAVPQILLWADDKARRLVLMEWTPLSDSGMRGIKQAFLAKTGI